MKRERTIDDFKDENGLIDVTRMVSGRARRKLTTREWVLLGALSFCIGLFLGYFT